MIINGSTIRNPDWQDSQSNKSSNQNLHYARDGSTYRVYKKTSNYDVVKFTLGYIAYDDAWTVFNTIKSNMHQAIEVTDWDSNVWADCRIITNPWELSHVLRKCNTDYGTEMYQLSLEFEGVPA